MDFKRLVREMNMVVKTDEPRTLQCQWFFHEGENKWYLTEVFADSDALLHHMHNTGTHLGELLGMSEVSRFEVFGNVSHAARSVIASFGVRYFTLFDEVSHELIT
jgi:hypothetical protein